MPETSLIWRVNQTPRFPLLSLGEYLAADDGRRETMRRKMKFERLAPTLLYRKVQTAVARFLAHPTRQRSILEQCREELEDERLRATTPTAADNAVYAMRALDTFERSLNHLPLSGLILERPPLYRPMLVEGVKISIQPTVRIIFNRPRGCPLNGAIVVDTAKGIVAKTEKSVDRTTEGMIHAAYMLHEHVSNTCDESCKPSSEHCIIYNSYRGELVKSPQNYKRTLEISKAALRDVCVAWQSIAAPESFDPSRARYRD